MMEFFPEINSTIQIGDKTFYFPEHPGAPGLPIFSFGSQAKVFKMVNGDDAYALKVLNPAYKSPHQVTNAKKLKTYATIGGFRVADRMIINPKEHYELIGDNPDLEYAIVMPWIEGPTWVEILGRKLEISVDDSNMLATAISKTLVDLEAKKCAHCDVAGTNIIISCMNGNSVNGSHPIQFIDIEDLYVKGLSSPREVPKGTDGYNHISGLGGLWNQYADRFAGAVLLSEVLTWSNEQIRDLAGEEGYFSASETQKPGSKYEAILDDLRKRWGEPFAALFERAWESEKVYDCPTFREWHKIILAHGKIIELNGYASGEETTPIDDTSEQQIFVLMKQASDYETQGDYKSAIDTYKQVLDLADMESEWIREIPLILKRLKTEIGEDLKETSGQLTPPPNNQVESRTFETGIKQYVNKRSRIIVVIVMAISLIVFFTWQGLDDLTRIIMPARSQQVLACSFLAAVSGLSQLVFLKFNVKNKVLWGLVGALGGATIGFVFPATRSPNPYIYVSIFGAVTGAIIGMIQTRLLDGENSYRKGAWILATAFGWALGWGLAYLVAWNVQDALAKAVASAGIILFSSVTVYPIVRRTRGIEI